MSDQQLHSEPSKGRSKRLVAGGVIVAAVAGLAYYGNQQYQPFNSDAISVPEPDCTYFRVPCRTFPARVIAVPDTDDVHVQCKDLVGTSHQVRVRLAEIDCPEYGQPYYDQAKQYTSNEALGKDVTIRFRQYNDFSRFGGICRIVGWVTLPDGSDLSRKLLSSGLAWHYKQYSENLSELDRIESEAKLLRRGLWVDDSPVAPWDYREMKRR